MRRTLPLVAIIGCSYAPDRFVDDFANQACRQEQRCSDDSWLLVDGVDACREEAASVYAWGLEDPCMVYDADEARTCVDAIREAGCEAEERVIALRGHAACNLVFTWSESEECNLAVPGFVGLGRSGRARAGGRRVRG